VIRIERSEIQSAYEWYRRRDSLDLEPPYQRRANIWKSNAKSFLIDSMINGFDVPKLYVADLALLPGVMRAPGNTHAVIDGKQRLESLFQWFDGSLPLNSDFVYRRDPLIEASRMTCSQLSVTYPDLAVSVEEFPLHVMNVIADHQDEINQLFIRLNQSKSLSGAETRNAMEGKAPEIIRRLAKHPFITDRVAFSALRGGDLNTVAKVLLMESTGDFVDVKRRRLDLFVEAIANGVERADMGVAGLEEAATSVETVFDGMATVFESSDPLLTTQGQVPVYYWLVRELGARSNLRSFIEDFEREREANRRLIAEVGTQGPIDVELLRYDQLNRSVNDVHSLTGRFEILRLRYQRTDVKN
jgi:hypothetical protein